MITMEHSPFSMTRRAWALQMVFMKLQEQADWTPQEIIDLVRKQKWDQVNA